MNSILIPKKHGKFRRVFCPDPELKRQLRARVPQLNLVAEELDVHRVQHGFTEGRSPLTNAKVHVGYAYSVCFDLIDFFPSVTSGLVYKALGPGRTVPSLVECFVEDMAAQGLPTSPALANIAASPMDAEIWERFCKTGGRFGSPPAVMTRYADDITLSTNSEVTVKLLLDEIPKIVERHGFKVNPEKTKVQCAKAGRRIITGIAVGEKDVEVPREIRRRIRAGKHQDKHGLRRRTIRRILLNQRKWKKRLPLRLRFHWQLQGLQQWARLKHPAELLRHKPSKVMAVAVKVVRAVCGETITQRVFGKYERRLG